MPGSEPRALEGNHPPEPDRHWQESWYFNFADERAGLFGLTRIGWQPARGLADGLWLAIADGEPAILYAPVWQRAAGPRVRIDAPAELRTGGLAYRCAAPLAAWELSVATRGLDAALRFDAFTPPYHYPPPASGPAAAAATAHYEQGGRVTGEVRHRGRTWMLDGWGQRDHSWGPRHWAGVGRWVWASAQFPSGWCLNFWRVGEGADAVTVGFVGTRAGTVAVTAGEVRWLGDPTGASPTGVELRVELADGSARDVAFDVAGRFPLWKGGANIQECFGVARSGGERGVGVVEHLRRARRGDLRFLRHAPRYLRLALASR